VDAVITAVVKASASAANTFSGDVADGDGRRAR
jgi:hypothetical protein